VWRAIVGVAQWAIVLYLLWPLRGRVQGMGHFARVALGIFLFVVFSGKLLYDQVIARRQSADPREQAVHLAGMALGLVLIVGVVVLLIGILLANLLTSSLQPPEQ
jgi:Na+/proline symporter